MKVSGSVEENGIVAINAFDKYNSKNPIANWIMKGFHAPIYDAVNPEPILEVGCGEGYWVMTWAQRGISASGIDISVHAIDSARSNTQSVGLSDSRFP